MNTKKPISGSPARAMPRGVALGAVALLASTATTMGATAPTTAPAAHGQGHGASAHAAAADVVSMDVYAAGDGDRIHLLTAVREGGRAAVLQYQRSDDGGGT